MLSGNGDWRAPFAEDRASEYVKNMQVCYIYSEYDIYNNNSLFVEDTQKSYFSILPIGKTYII